MIIWRTAALLQLKTLFRFCAITKSNSASFMETRRPSRVVPALFTRISSRPRAAVAAFTTSRAVSKRLTSPCTLRAPPLPVSISATTSAAAAVLVL